MLMLCLCLCLCLCVKGWLSLAHKHNISITSENNRDISIIIRRRIRRTNPLICLKAGLHCDISISTSINISITNVHTCCISTRKLTYASAMSSRMKSQGCWTSYVFKMADEDEILLLLLLLRRRRRRREQKRVIRKRSCCVRDIFRKRKEQGEAGDNYELPRQVSHAKQYSRTPFWTVE